MRQNIEEGDVAYVVAGVQLNHGDAACDNGFVGRAVKTKTPSAETVRTSRNVIAAGEAYTLLLNGVMEIPSASPLNAVAKGDMVWIKAADNTFATSAGSGFQILGRVSSLPSERGTPSNRIRVNLNQKV